EGDDFLTGFDGGNRRDAGAHRGAVDVDGARTALPEPAAEARPVQMKIAAQDVEQRHVRVVKADRYRLAVDGERFRVGHLIPPSAAFSAVLYERRTRRIT